MGRAWLGQLQFPLLRELERAGRIAYESWRATSSYDWHCPSHMFEGVTEKPNLGLLLAPGASGGTLGSSDVSRDSDSYSMLCIAHHFRSDIV
jgi:hypothetical protein